MKHSTLLIVVLMLGLRGVCQLGNGLIAYYPFNNGNTDNQAPTSFYTIFAQGTSPTSNALGAANQAMAFSGSSPQLWVGSEGLIDFGTTTSFSLVTDFRSGSAASQRFFSNLLTTGVGWRIGFLNSNGYITFESGVGASLVSVRTTNLFNDNSWHQVALLVDRTNQEVRIYVDNALQELAGTVCGTAVSGTAADISDCVFNANENNPQLTAFGAGMQGAMDEIRLYGRLLTTDEVTEAYGLSFGTTAIDAPFKAHITGIVNQVDGSLTLHGLGGMDWQVSVMDVQGRTVAIGRTIDDIHRLDLRHLSAGTFIVRCISGDLLWTQRFVMAN